MKIKNKILTLDAVDSTNNFLYQYAEHHANEPEGLVIAAKNQLKGKGQRGNSWHSESGKNLTFSLLLKPFIHTQNQFILSQLISLALIDFFNTFFIPIDTKKVTIKWPNDIYVGNNKIAGMLIENMIKKERITQSIVGIGINVNQVNFDSNIRNPTSLKKELKNEFFDLSYLLHQVLYFINKRYNSYKTNNLLDLNNEYKHHLYLINQTANFSIKGKICKAKIVGVTKAGKLILHENGKRKDYDLKEIEFIKN